MSRNAETIMAVEDDEIQRMEKLADQQVIKTIRDKLERTEKGSIRGTMKNYLTVLREDPLLIGCLKYNLFTEKIDVVKNLWWNTKTCRMNDRVRNKLYYYFERYYGLSSEKNMDKALVVEADCRAYHPIRDYLEGLAWDGIPRVRYMFQVYLGAEPSDYVYTVVRHYFMEALNRIYDPGCKADEMLCLVGQQGAGKSTLLRFMALRDEWFSDDLKNLTDSKVYELLRGHWIIEMSEMVAAISAKTNEETKSFLTRQKDTYRDPYARFEEDRYRQCVFAGSTNTRQFLPFDRSGSRRFLPIEIDSSKAQKHILDNEEESRYYCEQVWAELMVEFKAAENKSSLLKFTKEEEQMIEAYRRQFMQEDTQAGMIQGWLDSYEGDHVCSIQIWKEVFAHYDQEPKKFQTNDICQIMDTQIIGWRRSGYHRFTKEGYGRQRCWVRAGTEEKGGNEEDDDGFLDITQAEQMELPF